VRPSFPSPLDTSTFSYRTVTYYEASSRCSTPLLSDKRCRPPFPHPSLSSERRRQLLFSARYPMLPALSCHATLEIHPPPIHVNQCQETIPSFSNAPPPSRCWGTPPRPRAHERAARDTSLSPCGLTVIWAWLAALLAGDPRLAGKRRTDESSVGPSPPCHKIS
jgi:hypothetical protein